MRVIAGLAAAFLTALPVAAANLPSPAFKQVTIGGALVTGVGTAANTVAAGNDSRITGALQASNALSELTAAAAAARASIGAAPLASPALTGTPTAPTATTGTNTTQVGTTAFTTAAVAAEAALRVSGDALALAKASNLSDLASTAAAKTNLGLAAVASSGSASDLTTGTLPAARLPISRTVVADANYTMLATDTYVALTSITSPRTLRLPAANTVPAGKTIRIADESGAVTGSNTLTIAPLLGGTDTLDGGTSLVMTSAYVDVTLISDGASKWSYDIRGVARGGTGATTASGARTSLGLVAVAASGSAADLSTGTLPAARLPALTGDVTTSAGNVFTTIGSNTVSNAKLANMAAGTVKANLTGGTNNPNDVTPSAVLDTFASAQGSLLYRGASGWAALAPCAAGQVLSSGGTGANPSCVSLSNRTAIADANYTIVAADKYVAYTSITAPRAATLPAASAVPAGYTIRIADESGGVSGTNTLSVARAGSDTINGATSLVMSSAYVDAAFTSDGSSKWTYDVRGIARGGTGATTASGARTNLGLVAIAASGSAADLTTGTLPAARLPTPSSSTLGGVQSKAAVASQFLTSISTSGVPASAQPAATDITGLATVATSGSAFDVLHGLMIVGQSAVASSTTGSTTETALGSIKVPGNLMGPNGCGRVVTTWTYTASTNTKTWRTRIGAANDLTGTVIFTNNTAVGTNVTARFENQFCNRNATNSQLANGISGFGASAVANVATTVDTTQDSYIVITGQNGNSGETITLESYQVLVTRP